MPLKEGLQEDETDAKPTFTIPAFFRGSLSGVVVVAALQPLDVIKTVQQASGKNAIESGKQIIQQDGLRGLWFRGLGPTLVRGALGPGIYFQALEIVSTGKAKETPLVSFLQGAFARSIGAVVISPFSVLKSRIEWDPRSGVRFASFNDMFVGLSHTLLRDVPFSGLYVMFYRMFKSDSYSTSDSLEGNLHRQASQKSKSAMMKAFTSDFAAGLAAGFLATAVTHPFDVFKTRSQVGLPLVLNNSMKDVLMSGLSLRLAKRPLSMAMTWALFELVSSSTQQSNLQKFKSC